ncbi:MAG: ester cyclase [Acidobacteriota bacterium]
MTAAKDVHDRQPLSSREVARRFREDLWNSGELSIADGIIHKDCELHARVPFDTGFTTGPEAVKQLVSFYHFAFSDIEMRVEQLIVDGADVAVRWSARGRQTGDVLGLPATGKEILTHGIDMLRIEDGKIVEGWVNWDVLGLLEQAVAPDTGDGSPGLDAQAGFMNLVSMVLRAGGK